mmetsp:Transcript_27377/g.38203  ORF Transcript_27377/g.38203 Transcript_27377/m.38203 type:complete len:206 (+) Transcript_27377:301-918(+)
MRLGGRVVLPMLSENRKHARALPNPVQEHRQEQALVRRGAVLAVHAVHNVPAPPPRSARPRIHLLAEVSGSARRRVVPRCRRLLGVPCFHILLRSWNCEERAEENRPHVDLDRPDVVIPPQQVHLLPRLQLRHRRVRSRLPLDRNGDREEEYVLLPSVRQQLRIDVCTGYFHYCRWDAIHGQRDPSPQTCPSSVESRYHQAASDA